MLLLEFPKGTTHTELVAFIHRQHSRDTQRDESYVELLNNPPSVEQQVDGCTRCPTSLFVTCKSKAYATYESDDLLRNAIHGCSGKTWSELEGSKVICKEYAPQDDDKNTLKHDRGTGFFIRWKSLVPFYVPHRRRRAFLMRSRNPEFELPLNGARWRTQRHNEPLLNQAFNIGTAVYLVFCARQAREIFGIARMEEPIPITSRRPSDPPPTKPESGPELGSPFRISWEGRRRHIPFDTLLQEENSCLREGISMIKGGRDGIELSPEFLNSVWKTLSM